MKSVVTQPKKSLEEVNLAPSNTTGATMRNESLGEEERLSGPLDESAVEMARSDQEIGVSTSNSPQQQQTIALSSSSKDDEDTNNRMRPTARNGPRETARPAAKSVIMRSTTTKKKQFNYRGSKQKMPPLLKFLLLGMSLCVVSLMVGSNLHSYVMEGSLIDIDLMPPPREQKGPTIRKTSAKTVIIVLSGRSHAKRRNSIRSTWATGHDNVYFVVGQECPHPPSKRKSELTCELDDNKNKKGSDNDDDDDDGQYALKLIQEEDALKKEQSKHQDMIVVEKLESYRSLPNKLKEAIYWIGENLQDVQWIVKADDDFFVRVDSISAYLEDNHDASEPAVIGKIMKRAPVWRDGKWKEDHWKPGRYPQFPLGSHGYAISQPVAEFVAANKDSLFEYQGEDTSIGIWIKESTTLKGVNFKESKLFDNKANCMDRGIYVSGHDITTEQMKKCYENADEVVQPRPSPSSKATVDPSAAEADGEPQADMWMPARLTNSTIAVVVMSARKNVGRRMAIRESWAKGHDNVFFVVAEACPYGPHQIKDQLGCDARRGTMTVSTEKKQANEVEDEALRKEQAEYRDLVMAPTRESYRSLVFKLKYAMDWVVTHVGSANWFVKTDDDMFARVNALELFLQNYSPTNPMVVGKIVPNSPVWKDGKWADWYDKRTTYPPWPQGSCGYAVSRPIAEYIKSKRKNLIEYQGEDSTLGIWIHEESALKKTIFEHTPVFHNEGQCDETHLVVGHALSVEKIKRCHEQMQKIDGAPRKLDLKGKDATDSVNDEEEEEEEDIGGSAPTSWTSPRITNATTVVVIMSARRNFRERKAIRETWATGHDNVYFVVSDACPHPPELRRDDMSCELKEAGGFSNLFWKKAASETDDEYTKALEKEQRRLRKEQEKYEDMIYVEKHESFHGMVRKLKEAYHWVVTSTQADWIAKADDDTFVRVDSMSTFLKKYSPSNPTIIGRIIKGSPVWKTGQWADTEYDHNTYPFWPQGSCGHVVSRPLAQWVSDHKEETHEYQGEDTSLGIWIDESPIKESVVWESSSKFMNEGKCNNPEYLMIGHDLSAKEMRQCYEAGDEVEEDGKYREKVSENNEQKDGKPDENAEYDERLIIEKKEAMQKGLENLASWPAPKITKARTIVLVLTARNNFEKRIVIRNNWANGHDNVYFVVGEACHVPKNHRSHVLTCEKRDRGHSSFAMMGSIEQQKEDAARYAAEIAIEQEKLLAEQQKHQDMIYTPKPESYRGLVHKLKEGYIWAIKNTKAAWIAKADDDMYVRVASLSKLLRKLRSPRPTVVGRIIWSSPVHKGGKWADLDYNKNDTYPPWPQGSCGHVVNRKVAGYIVENKDTLYEYQGEDTSLGIWLNESPFKKDLFYQDSKAFTNNANCHNQEAVIIGHQLSGQHIRKCYKSKDETLRL